MPLPNSLLSAVAGHRCFAGCYSSDPVTHVCTDPAQQLLSPALQVVCSDCLSFRVGALPSTLPRGMSSHALANELSAHVRGLRGYVWATSGYSSAGTGLWITAAYYGNGLFLVDASRNGSQSTDLDILIRAFQLGVVSPEDPRMVLAALYTSEVVYVDMTQPITPVRCKQDLLASPHCRTTRTPGYQRATVLEFVPLARNALLNQSLAFAPPQTPAARPSTPPPAPAAPVAAARNSADANMCEKCGAEIKERPLFCGTYVGCLC